MKYFIFNPLGDKSNESYCFTSKTPDGGVDSYDLIAGFRLSDEYPEGIKNVYWRLGDNFLGLELASYIGNTHRILAFNKSAANLITSTTQSEIEIIPFTLLDYKGKVHSKDYVFINPVGSIDCINWKETVCNRRNNGDVANYEKLVLNKEKSDDLPHIFRIKYLTAEYIFSETLVNTLLNSGHSNLVFREIEFA
ncbi:imm11 family protein [Hahella sp. NBU794]|uniref:imm11 family protein n=1 Tax=Hahella sp. NBU794 TaxID=3422590 RepID=UPI003D6E4A5A